MVPGNEVVGQPGTSWNSHFQGQRVDQKSNVQNSSEEMSRFYDVAMYT